MGDVTAAYAFEYDYLALDSGGFIVKTEGVLTIGNYLWIKVWPNNFLMESVF